MYSRGMLSSTHTYSAEAQLTDDRSQDMTMSSDPEYILASVSTINDIRQENGKFSNTPKVCHGHHAIQGSYISNPRCLVR